MFARHQRAKYCSARCSQKDRDARFRKRFTKSERSDRRHKYYEKRVRRLYGNAALKVEKRVRPAQRK
jgi:hypothetical protein